MTIVLLPFALLLAFAFSTTDLAKLLGAWEGESKCTVPGSPCHDEHVVYEIKAVNDKPSIAMFKIVNGEKQFMGTIACGEPREHRVSCTIPNKNRKRIDDWVFEINGNQMDGILYIDKERTVYRNIHVKKKN